MGKELIANGVGVSHLRMQQSGVIVDEISQSYVLTRLPFYVHSESTLDYQSLVNYDVGSSDEKCTKKFVDNITVLSQSMIGKSLILRSFNYLTQD